MTDRTDTALAIGIVPDYHDGRPVYFTRRRDGSDSDLFSDEAEAREAAGAGDGDPATYFVRHGDGSDSDPFTTEAEAREAGELAASIFAARQHTTGEAGR